MKVKQILWLSTGDPASDATLRFAAGQLALYAAKLGRPLPTQRADSYTPQPEAIWLGLCGRLPAPAASEIKSALWDDGYALLPEKDSFFLIGQNARSVLFAVYDLLERQGVRFVRPGADGEILPKGAKFVLPSKPVVEKAVYRHRGVCIEGAPSLEHALDMVDWCAKKRMNTLFLQFFSSRYFYNHWYARDYNPDYADHEVSDVEAIAKDTEVVSALKKRGMVYHQVGHGWTATTVGLPRSGWVTTEEPPLPGRERWLAEVNGKRELFHKIPINTELCYSHSPAFEALVETIVRYVESHPELDIVHVWLSDATNNKCECAECRPLNISDWYAKIINALSEAFAQRAPGKRFVFLCYFELLWPPEKIEIDERHGNAVLMFAPISRTYGRSLGDPAADDGKAYPRPLLNQFGAPRSNAFFAKTLTDWLRAFKGDSFDFDYHLMWAIWRHLTDTVVARTYYQDLQQLKKLGLDGIISCQSFRVFYPSGLAMTVLAEALWNPQTPLAEIKKNYMQAAFGDQAAAVDGHLQQVERFLDTGDPDWVIPPLSNADAAKLSEFGGYLKGALADIRSWRAGAQEPTQRRSLDILAHHARYLQMIVKAYQAKLQDKPKAAGAALDRAANYLKRTELRGHRFMDTMLMLRVVIDDTRRRLGL
jgi:hypothetical protein